MGDNVMIYLDDIQHVNPELLQKFISLCDAQRKIEGVYRERPRTYDLRGRKVCVVMAGNPYTESGEMFKIPDMLANRSDTFNLGDIIGGHEEAFRQSYLENALTSNPVLARLASGARGDIYGVIRLAQDASREGVDFEGRYTPEEIAEFVSVMRKLLRVRDVVLTVNQAYIRSAAQADEFRAEPPFKLQGSYRNMNRLAARVLPVMNDDEIEALLLSHYTSEAQTLTTGAEANLLKFKEMTGRISSGEALRWEEIKRTFQRNQLYREAGDDRLGQAVVQLTTFGESLGQIRDALRRGVEQSAGQARARGEQRVTASLAAETLDRLTELVAARRGGEAPAAEAPAGLARVLAGQLQLMREWMVLSGGAAAGPAPDDAAGARKRMQEAIARCEALIGELNADGGGSGPSRRAGRSGNPDGG
jgi:hypothetical protein